MSKVAISIFNIGGESYGTPRFYKDYHHSKCPRCGSRVDLMVDRDSYLAYVNTDSGSQIADMHYVICNTCKANWSVTPHLAEIMRERKGALEWAERQLGVSRPWL